MFVQMTGLWTQDMEHMEDMTIQDLIIVLDVYQIDRLTESYPPFAVSVDPIVMSDNLSRRFCTSVPS